MVSSGMEHLGIDGVRLLIIENVGNLVCPSVHDLGEDIRVTILSVCEGEDKPLKYPTIFKSSHVVIVSKTDVSEPMGFDRETALRNIREVAPQVTIFETSARTGAGMHAWREFLLAEVRKKTP